MASYCYPLRQNHFFFPRFYSFCFYFYMAQVICLHALGRPMTIKESIKYMCQHHKLEISGFLGMCALLLAGTRSIYSAKKALLSVDPKHSFGNTSVSRFNFMAAIPLIILSLASQNFSPSTEVLYGATATLPLFIVLIGIGLDFNITQGK